MSGDVINDLVNRIWSVLPPHAGQVQSNANSDFFAGVDNVVGLAASYLQILGSFSQPVAQALAAGWIADITATGTTLQQLAQAPSEASAASQALAALQQGAEAGSVAASAAVASATVAAEVTVIVVILAFVLAAVTADSGSSQSDELQQLAGLEKDIEGGTIAIYWADRLANIQSFWSTPQGGIGDDLDNLASQGLLPGNYASTDVSKFHDHAQAFVNNLVQGYSLDWQIFWERQYVSTQALLILASVPYPNIISASLGWYGAPRASARAAARRRWGADGQRSANLHAVSAARAAVLSKDSNACALYRS